MLGRTHNVQTPLLLFPPPQPNHLVYPRVKPSDAVVELHSRHGGGRLHLIRVDPIRYCVDIDFEQARRSCRGQEALSNDVKSDQVCSRWSKSGDGRISRRNGSVLCDLIEALEGACTGG